MPSEVGKAAHEIQAQSLPTATENKAPQQMSSTLPPYAALSVGDRTLQFLSTASNETLGACFVGLGACTYLILGRLGLVLIGAVGGIVLHSSWENSTDNTLGDQSQSKEARRRQELGLDVVSRVLKWREKARPLLDKGASQDAIPGPPSQVNDYSSFALDTASALEELTSAVIRDYVKYWYSPILPHEESFPSAARRNFTYTVTSIASHLSRQRPADTFLDFAANSSSILIVFINELSNAISSFPSDDCDSAITKYLESRPDSNLGNILDVGSQEKKLSIVADDVLENFLEPATYRCEAPRVFFTQILSDLILKKTMQSCSKSDWINGWIIYLLEEGEPEILKSIDVGIANEESSIGRNLKSASNGVSVSSRSSMAAQDESRRHRKRVSKAEEAMEEAMEEAKRLSRLIADEDKKRRAEQLASGDGTDFHSPIRGSPQGSPKIEPLKSPVSLDLRRDTNAGNSFSIDETKATPSVNPPSSSFTSFDQLGISKPTALQSNPPSPIPKLEPPEISTMTLHNAKISIFDDAMPGEKTTIRAKPNTDYLIQIEPANSSHPGWMIARRYQDFETLHEILRRISVVSGVKAFSEQHSSLAHWKGHTKISLRGELERYLRDALWFRQLAESEGMKRFLEKDQGLGAQSSPGSASKPFPTTIENVGKGVLDVLTNAPKGAADGGKAVLGGITGAFGAVSSLGQKRSLSRPSNSISRNDELSRSSTSLSSVSDGRQSQELQNASRYSTQSSRQSLGNILERERASENGGENTPSASLPGSLSSTSSFHERRTNQIIITPDESPKASNAASALNLPPPPSEIADDFNIEDAQAQVRHVFSPANSGLAAASTKTSTGVEANASKSDASSTLEKARRKALTEQETQVAVELFFAVINELYTLSSAWNIRKTLLTAAKTFLLRPGNPNLESIRVLLQDSIIEANISDSGLAGHIRKLRENTLPTAEELESWPKELSLEEKESQRIKARKLLVERGMPQALTSVMGSAASGEALGRVFDCLQIEHVAQGLVFGLMLQAVRAVTQ
ncbi:MAG: hypothetical protein M1814_000448 [Vezdaea aestivalis]|nr:MAG: hypothetical protein M1814_000448 [Vezdaea aestivalis]